MPYYQVNHLLQANEPYKQRPGELPNISSCPDDASVSRGRQGSSVERLNLLSAAQHPTGVLGPRCSACSSPSIVEPPFRFHSSSVWTVGTAGRWGGATTRFLVLGGRDFNGRLALTCRRAPPCRSITNGRTWLLRQSREQIQVSQLQILMFVEPTDRLN